MTVEKTKEFRAGEASAMKSILLPRVPQHSRARFIAVLEAYVETGVMDVRSLLND